MLTDISIKSLIAPANLPNSRRETPDGKVAGLFFIIQPSGAASWALRYRAAGGAPRKLTLGPFPALDLKAARRAAEDARGRIAKGEDPAREKTAARAAAKAEREADHDLVERVVEQFVERHAKAHTRDWRETERILNRNVVDRWRGRRLSQIGRADVHNLLDAIADRGAPIAANRVLAQLRVMCKWAVGRGIIENSPCEDVKAPASEKGRERDRVLEPAELRLVWDAVDALGWPWSPFVRLLALTGQRRDEIAGMRWSELSLEKAVWMLPGERSKNRRANEVPLSAAALEILRSLPRFEKSDLVFTTNGKTPISGFSPMKRRLDNAIAEIAASRGAAPVAPWTLHDLRRSAASGMASLGIGPHIVEAILNHKSGTVRGVAAVYNRYTYGPEKRAALAAWATRVEAIVSGGATSNVVKLKAMS
jgi:integrase